MSVTLHTNLGDIKCEIACDEVPKTAELFCSLLKAPLIAINNLMCCCALAKFLPFE